MTILDKLTKVNAEQAALAQRRQQLEADVKAATDKLVAAYGEDWETKYQAEVAKLEAYDAAVTA